MNDAQTQQQQQINDGHTIIVHIRNYKSGAKGRKIIKVTKGFYDITLMEKYRGYQESINYALSELQHPEMSNSILAGNTTTITDECYLNEKSRIIITNTTVDVSKF